MIAVEIPASFDNNQSSIIDNQWSWLCHEKAFTDA